MLNGLQAICLHLQVVGGGNYVEHQSLQDWAQNSGRQVTCNDLVEKYSEWLLQCVI